MNDKTRTLIFNISALLVLAGAVLYAIPLQIAPYLFAVGSAGMAVTQLTMIRAMADIRQRRLQRFNAIACVFLILASGLMFKERNEWIACLTIAAIFLTYSAFASKPSK
ncbi:MAG: hypothetical protein LUH10_13150 [Tannerellaceae bacterium]|nr:hypothetical protein [Tannerellaceae bacterium]